MSYTNTNNEKFSKQILSSFVLNTPYQVDAFSSSPKLTKTLPFDIKLDSVTIAKITFKFITCSVVIMTAFCVVFFSILTPIQTQNNKLLNTSKNITNQQLILNTKAEEASTYKKLFLASQANIFTEPKEIIVVNNHKNDLFAKNDKKQLINIQYSGF
ncbi:MAG: hypothetical protein HYR97_01795 [Candidatus Melainabacteria bacterium]|nr:hypothetical protein [Candidatus Melainabacteria bacterium]MBI3309265.1 hypothetical protein [Candidatus Melainabacteria bacterium]